MYAPAERADTLPLFILYPCMYSVGCTMRKLCTLWPLCSCPSTMHLCCLPGTRLGIGCTQSPPCTLWPRRSCLSRPLWGCHSQSYSPPKKVKKNTISCSLMKQPKSPLYWREGGGWSQRSGHRVCRVAMTTLWRPFHHDIKISPGWWGRGVHAHPLSLYLPSRTKLCTVYAPAERADTLLLFLLYPYMYSVDKVFGTP